MDQNIRQSLWVVIPTYNRAEDLLACLFSLNQANLNDHQIIVVDNHSQDDTVNQIRELHPDLKLFSLEENLGATGASNIGFAYALNQGANFILRLDSDTIVSPEFIDPLLSAMLNDSKIGIVAPKIYYYQPPDEIWYAGADAHPFHFGAIHDHRHEKENPENNQIREVDYAWGAAMLIRDDILQKTHGFDTDFFVYYEELDFCTRVQELGFKIIYVPESNIWHKVGSSANNAWTAYHWNRSKILFYRKHAINLVHYFLLIVYAILYMLCSWVLPHKLGGNRGPLRAAFKGFIHGLLTKVDEQ